MGLMDRLFRKSPKTEAPPQLPVREEPARAARSLEGPAVPEGMVIAGALDSLRTMMIPGGAEAATEKALEGIAELAEAKSRELRSQESSMPSIEEAAEDEKAGVMRLDAESDAWSRIAGALNRTSSETDPFRRLARLRNEISVLRNTNLGKGPEAEVIKLLAVEEIEKRLRM